MIVRLDGSTDLDRKLLGGKAWSIQRMLAMGIPVPPAFVITTDACAAYYDAGRALPSAIGEGLPDALAWLEQQTGKTFGGDALRGPASGGIAASGTPRLPLLVSVRSGAAHSMPGMMDTILNLGIDDAVQATLAERVGDSVFAADTRRRYEEQYESVVGTPSPAAPADQLRGAIAAVFDSWQSDRANTYRRERGIAGVGGTAVTVQAMVFGNLDDQSGTGVLFTRDPLRGTPEPLGEWLPRGQGEDVVSGRHDPLPLAELAASAPLLHEELMHAAGRLEQDSRDVMDIEFTVEAGKLWLLQSRVAKRSPEAAVRLAVRFVEEELIERAEALDRVAPEQAAALLREHLDPVARAEARPLASGKPACPGVAGGTLVSDSDEAADRAMNGEEIILARATTDPNDVHAMAVVAGILTELGGATSHAAVVSRELGVPCVVGCGEGTLLPHTGAEATIDAAAGEVFAGRVAVTKTDEAHDADVHALAEWARAELPDAADAPLPELLSRRARSAATA